MEGLPNWQAYGVPAAYIIVAIFNWLKESFGMDSKWAFPVGTGIGGAIGVLLWLSETYAWALVAFQIVMGAILLGLAASGQYSLTKSYIESRSRDTDDVVTMKGA